MNAGPAKLRFRFEGAVWIYRNPAANYFVTLPVPMSEEILDLIGNSLNPWGTVPVDVTVGEFSWESSMFPRKERRCYDLPLNARIRKRLKIEVGQLLDFTIEITLPI